MISIPSNTQKPAAVCILADAVGVSVNGYLSQAAQGAIDTYFSEHAASHNEQIVPASGLGGGVEVIVRESYSVLRRSALALNTPLGFFSAGEPAVHPYQLPEARTLTLQNGYFFTTFDAPTVLNAERELVKLYASWYSGLIHAYDVDVSEKIQSARYIDGKLLVVMDDVGGLNYCHWLSDWMPRLSLIPEITPDLHVAVLPLQAEWQRETLRAMGLSDSQIIEVHPWEVVQARELIVPNNLSQIYHAGWQGSPWALDFVHDIFDLPVAEQGLKKIYVSRRDAGGRRILNEDQLVPVLESLGFECHVLTGMTVAEQARLFNSASHVVSPHGAGLTNIIFAPSSARLLEIFPPTYGTPAFWLLAASRGIDYACYTVEKSLDSQTGQADDFSVDVEDFKARCLAFLTAEA